MAEEIEIKDRTRAVFTLPSGKQISVSIREGALRISGEDGPITIEPQASNVVWVLAGSFSEHLGGTI